MFIAEPMRTSSGKIGWFSWIKVTNVVIIPHDIGSLLPANFALSELRGGFWREFDDSHGKYPNMTIEELRWQLRDLDDDIEVQVFDPTEERFGEPEFCVDEAEYISEEGVKYKRARLRLA